MQPSNPTRTSGREYSRAGGRSERQHATLLRLRSKHTRNKNTNYSGFQIELMMQYFNIIIVYRCNQEREETNRQTVSTMLSSFYVQFPTSDQLDTRR